MVSHELTLLTTGLELAKLAALPPSVLTKAKTIAHHLADQDEEGESRQGHS
jgi:DNA mismatch repair ATPase MutS